MVHKDLSPCPCCAEPARVIDQRGVFDCGLVIECTGCGLRTPRATYYDANDMPGVVARRPDMARGVVLCKLKRAWNMRAGARCAQEMMPLEELLGGEALDNRSADADRH